MRPSAQQATRAGAPTRARTGRDEAERGQVVRDHRRKVLHAQMRDVLHQRLPALGRHLRHQAEVQDADAPVGRADQVACARGTLKAQGEAAAPSLPGALGGA
jgi:hypothetical protein